MNFLIFLIKKLRKNISAKILNILGRKLILNSKLVESNFKCLEESEFKIYSQNGEDGIINFLITRLGINKPSFVELGVGDYSEANTRFLYEIYYSKGLIVDCFDNLNSRVNQNVSLWRGNLKVINRFIEVDNINEIIKENCDFNIDLFSIDLDGIDYWILKNLNLNSKPKIFVIEYNSNFNLKNVSVPNKKKFDRKKYHYSNLCYGASITAFINLMYKKGYYLIGVNNMRNNAFFISNNYPKDKYFKNIEVPELKDLIDANFSESRSLSNKLSFLNKKNRVREIENCEVINLNNHLNDLVKLKDILDEK